MALRILSLFMLFYCSISYAELITSLPGQPFNVSFRQYSGPGCSSLGFGAFMELGPFKPSKNGSLVKNDYSWNLGHYIPQLAKLLIEYNRRPSTKPIKLKSIALGNPLLDLDISVQAGNYLWAHGAISDKTLYLERTVCNNSKYLREYAHNQYSEGCNYVFNITVPDEVGKDVQFYDLLLPKCPSDLEKISCRNVIIQASCWPLVYQEDNLDMNLIPLVAEIIQEGIPIWLYSGDQDSKISLTQTRLIANNLARDLKLVTFSNYVPWYDKKQVGGWSQSFGVATEGESVPYLTFVTVRGAAHEVPFTSPSQALTLFRSFLSGSPLPRPRVR
ncbi:hypothetical protein BT93_J1486 [Corymbia citriodora subsp. variegata]|nr:hypothetical protein BT93_J1486 [Corymbia citriodora subsp. variegata]